MVKIYTRGGDKGSTQVYMKEMVRVSKSDEKLELYGTLDELNSHVGLLASLIESNHPLQEQLQLIQRQLFQLGFVISADATFTQDDISKLEADIDEMVKSLAPMTSFILPGGCQGASQAHVCRTVCRRAERILAAVAEGNEVPQTSQGFINRLSDYFFVVARFLNFESGLDDIKL